MGPLERQDAATVGYGSKKDEQLPEWSREYEGGCRNSELREGDRDGRARAKSRMPVKHVGPEAASLVSPWHIPLRLPG